MKEWTKSDSLTVSMQAFSKNGRIPEIFALEKTTHVVARDLSNCRAFLKMVKLLITVIQNQLPFIAVYCRLWWAEEDKQSDDSQSELQTIKCQI